MGICQQRRATTAGFSLYFAAVSGFLVPTQLFKETNKRSAILIRARQRLHLSHMQPDTRTVAFFVILFTQLDYHELGLYFRVNRHRSGGQRHDEVTKLEEVNVKVTETRLRQRV